MYSNKPSGIGQFAFYLADEIVDYAQMNDDIHVNK